MLAPQQAQAFREMWLAGVPGAVIACDIRLSIDSVYQHRREMNLPLRGSGGGRKQKRPAKPPGNDRPLHGEADRLIKLLDVVMG